MSLSACSEEPKERAEVAYVYYLWGQSNMAGITKAFDWSDIYEEHGIFTGLNFEAQKAEDFAGSPYTNSGIELQLGKQLANRHPDGDVFFVKRATGSTSVAWHWNTVTSTNGRGAELTAYKSDIQKAHRVLEQLGYTVRPQLLLSFIGESDSGSLTSALNFESNYLGTTAAIIETIGVDVPVSAYNIWISEETKASFPFPHVEEVQSQYAQLRLEGVNVIETADVERAIDGIHVTREGFRQLEAKGI